MSTCVRQLVALFSKVVPSNKICKWRITQTKQTLFYINAESAKLFGFIWLLMTSFILPD